MARLRRLRFRREMLLLFALVAVLVFLWVCFSAEPVYADCGTLVITPGEGGGTPQANTVEGWVVNLQEGARPEGLKVCLYNEGGVKIAGTWTDVYGYFVFHHPYIYPNQQYYVAVNGEWESLGITCEDIHWGQYLAIIHTDPLYGYCQTHIMLEPAAIVNVTAAALFSNTKYATISYEMTGTYSFSHGLSFSLENPSISVGYTTSMNVQYTYIFKVTPGSQARIVKRHYAATYWDDNKPGIVKTGIADAEQSWDWDLLREEEYLNPNNLPYYIEHRLDPVGSITVSYTETGSYTWSASSVPFAISYMAFGVTIHLDTTVTSTESTTVEYVIDRSGDTNPNTLTFRVYTAGALLDTVHKKGGMEIHIWDMSGAG